MIVEMVSWRAPHMRKHQAKLQNFLDIFGRIHKLRVSTNGAIIIYVVLSTHKCDGESSLYTFIKPYTPAQVNNTTLLR